MRWSKGAHRRQQTSSVRAMTQHNTNTEVGSCMMVIKPDQHLLQASKKGFFTLDCGHRMTVLNQVAATCKPEHMNNSAMPVKTGKIHDKNISV